VHMQPLIDNVRWCAAQTMETSERMLEITDRCKVMAITLSYKVALDIVQHRQTNSATSVRNPPLHRVLSQGVFGPSTRGRRASASNRVPSQSATNSHGQPHQYASKQEYEQARSQRKQDRFQEKYGYDMQHYFKAKMLQSYMILCSQMYTYMPHYQSIHDSMWTTPTLEQLLDGDLSQLEPPVNEEPSGGLYTNMLSHAANALADARETLLRSATACEPPEFPDPPAARRVQQAIPGPPPEHTIPTTAVSLPIPAVFHDAPPEFPEVPMDERHFRCLFYPQGYNPFALTQDYPIGDLENNPFDTPGFSMNAPFVEHTDVPATSERVRRLLVHGSEFHRQAHRG
jgi:hypothetical protein